MNKQKKESNRTTEGDYKFKYTYLILILFFGVLNCVAHFLPYWMPSFFNEEKYTIYTDENGEKYFIKDSGNGLTLIVEMIENLSVTALIAVILSFFYEHRFEKEKEEMLVRSVNTILYPKIKEIIIESLLQSPQMINHVFSTDFRRKLLFNCLVRELGDEEKARATLDSLVKNVIDNSETIDDVDVSFVIEDFEDSDHEYSRYDSFKITYTMRYNVILKTNSFRFILTKDKKYQLDNLSIFAFIYYSENGFDGNKVFFNIRDAIIENKILGQNNRYEDESKIILNYWNDKCRDLKGKKVKISYSAEFLMPKTNNFITYFTPAMTKGIHIKFESKAEDIERITARTFFNSGYQPIIAQKGINPKSVEITLNDWILPLSGAVCIWQFDKRD